MDEKIRLGGMALINGVLVHGPNSWACAIRTPGGEMKVAVRDYKRFRAATVRNPLLRGPARMAEVFALLPRCAASCRRRDCRSSARRCSRPRWARRWPSGRCAVAEARARSRGSSSGAPLASAGALAHARRRARRLPRRRAHLDRDLRARRAAGEASTSAAARTCSARCVASSAVGGALASRAPAHLRTPARVTANSVAPSARRSRSSPGWPAIPSTRSRGHWPSRGTSSSTESRPPSRLPSSSRSPRLRWRPASSWSDRRWSRPQLSRRLPPDIFELPVEKMREGYYTDAYFNHTRDVLIAGRPPPARRDAGLPAKHSMWAASTRRSRS